MLKVKKLVIVLGVATALSSLAIPLSATRAKSAWQQESVTLNIGIAPYVGVTVVSNTAGTGVHFSDGVYTKTMVNGEGIENFGTTRLKVVCNIETNTDPNIYNGRNCKTNGWSLNVTPAPGYIVSKGGNSYTAMTKTTDSDAILSSADSVSGDNSNWALKVTPVTQTIGGTTVSADVTSGYGSMHHIPAATTAIASSTSWRTIGGVSTYIPNFEVDVQYGVKVSGSQSAGTYTGAVDYTVSLNASS